MTVCPKWEVLFFVVFAEQYERLVLEVEELRNKDQDGYKSHPRTKLLASLHNAVFHEVPEDPLHKRYFLGKTLGQHNQHWKRVKKGLPQRHRAFFQRQTSMCNVVFAWCSLDGDIRKAGDLNDVYAVMKRLIDSGKIPSQYTALVEHSRPAEELAG